MSIAEDVIGIKNEVAKEWGTIYDNSKSINLFITQGLAWLKENEGTFWTDFETALEQFESGLESVAYSDIKAAIEAVESTVETDAAPFFSEISELKSELSPAQVLSAMLKGVQGIENLNFSSPIPGLNLSTMENIVERIFGNHFSIAFRKIPPSDGGGTSGGTAQQAEEGQALADLIFDAFEKDLGNFLSNPITVLNAEKQQVTTSIQDGWNKLESKLGGIVTGQLGDLETNVATLITNLENNLDSLTSDLIIEQFKTLFKTETTALEGAAKTLLSDLESDLGYFRQFLEILMAYTADADSALANLFQEVFDADPPTLLEVISFIIAIPMTLTAQATGNSSFAFPTFSDLQKASGTGQPGLPMAQVEGAKKSGGFDSAEKTLMTGILQVLDIVISIGNRLYTGTHTTTYKYKIFMGVVSTIKSVLFQVAFLPKSTNPVSKDNALWYISWASGVGFSTLKWVLGAYAAYQTNGNDSYKEAQAEVDSFCGTFNGKVKLILNDYGVLGNKLQGNLTFVKYDPTYLNSVINEFQNVKSGLTEEVNSVNWNSAMANFKSLGLDEGKVQSDLAKIFASIRVVKNAGTQKAQVATFLKEQNIAGYGVRGLSTRYPTVVAEAQSKISEGNKKESKKGKVDSFNTKFSGLDCPSLDVAISSAFFGWKVHLYTSENQDDATLTSDIVGFASSILSDGLGLYYYQKENSTKWAAKTDEEKEKSKNTKDNLSDVLLAVGLFWEGYQASLNLGLIQPKS